MVWWCLGALSVLVGGWGAISASRMLHPKPKILPAPQPSAPVTVIQLASHDHSPLEVWVFKASPPRALVMACHGYRANRLQLLDIASGLCQRGYVVMVFDLRGHGAHRGPCTFGIKDVEDLGLILRWVKGQPELASLPIGLFGLSLGGAIACQALQRFADCRAVVLDSTYARLFPIVAQAIRRDYGLPCIPWAWITWACVQLALGHRLSRLDPLRLAPRSRQPLLLIHSAADQSVPIEHAAALYAAWQGPKEFWVDSQAVHASVHTQDAAGYCDRLAAFFDRWLKPAPPSSRC